MPVVVRGVQQGFCWAPQVMARATTEKNTKHGVDTNIEVRDSYNSLPQGKRLLHHGSRR